MDRILSVAELNAMWKVSVAPDLLLADYQHEASAHRVTSMWAAGTRRPVAAAQHAQAALYLDLAAEAEVFDPVPPPRPCYSRNCTCPKEEQP